MCVPRTDSVEQMHGVQSGLIALCPATCLKRVFGNTYEFPEEFRSYPRPLPPLWSGLKRMPSIEINNMDATVQQLNEIENLLTQAEYALEHDDGRRWPLPPPASPSDITKRAQDNSSAVDPSDEASIKAYAFATVPMLPVFYADQFPQRRSDQIVSMLQANPENSWIPRQEGLLSKSPAHLQSKRQHSEVEISGEHQYYGVRIFIERREGTTFVKWQSGADRVPDRRAMSHAQRLAEDRSLKCHCLAWPVLDAILDRANTLSEFFAQSRELGLAKMIEPHVFERYALNVAIPLLRFHDCVARLNKLGRDLYKQPERRLPLAGVGRLTRWDFVFHYPWSYPRKIWCSLLLGLLRDPVIRSRSFRESLSEHGFPDLSTSAIVLAVYCANYQGRAQAGGCTA
jgi:hypothetical protein